MRCPLEAVPEPEQDRGDGAVEIVGVDVIDAAREAGADAVVEDRALVGGGDPGPPAARRARRARIEPADIAVEAQARIAAQPPVERGLDGDALIGQPVAAEDLAASRRCEIKEVRIARAE